MNGRGAAPNATSASRPRLAFIHKAAAGGFIVTRPTSGCRRGSATQARFVAKMGEALGVHPFLASNINYRIPERRKGPTLDRAFLESATVCLNPPGPTTASFSKA